jgi:hypothetical protein
VSTWGKYHLLTLVVSQAVLVVMDTSSRRAFALDSRTVWVEQQIRHQVLLPRDNFVLGPGEYSLRHVERNVSTPAIGKYRTPADHFRPFRSSTINDRSQSPSTSPQRNGIGESSQCASSFESEHSEYTTIFHNHDRRTPFDPKSNFTSTPGSYVGPEGVFEHISVDGKNRVKHGLVFGPNNVPVERTIVKPALPSYDVQYDSPQIKPMPKLGSFPTTKRIQIPTNEEMKVSFHSSQEQSDLGESFNQHRPSTAEVAQRTGLTLFQVRCNLVPLPKLKTRAPPKLLFDGSCYHKKRLAEPIQLTRKIIDKQAQVDVFTKIIAIPRQHKSVEFSHFEHSHSQI